jgi:LysR family hydrogen peroxide-inducible transcriptional activator
MRLEQLRYLEAAIRAGALRAAAADLEVSQPTMSQQIQRLEEELDLVLLIRTRSGVRATDSAQRLLPHVRRLLAIERLLLEEAQAIRGIHVGRVHIGAVPTGLRVLLNDVVPGFRRQFPNVNLRVWEDQSEPVCQQVLEGLSDLGIIGRGPNDVPSWLSGLSVVDLAEEPLVLCLPLDHPLSKKSQVRPADILDEPWIAHGSGFALTLAARRLFDREPPEPVFHSNDTSSAIAMVAAGVGLAILPESAVTGEAASSVKILRELHGTARMPALTLSMVRREDSVTSPATRQISTMLRARSAEIAAERARHPDGP